MISTDHRAVELEPLRRLDSDDIEDSFPSDRVVDLEDGRRNDYAHSRGRATFWALCSAVAVYTTKRLMVNNGFHYPQALAFRSFAALAVVYIVALSIGSGSRYGLLRSDGKDFLPNKHWAAMVPAALTAAGSLPMLFEGILHMPSLPVLVMVFPVAYAAESLLLSICCSPSRTVKRVPWEAIVAVVASCVVLYNEYRLMVPGLLWGLLGILFIGFARALFTIGSERAAFDLSGQAKLKAYHGFVIMTLIHGMVSSGVSGHFLENIDSIYAMEYPTMALMFLNILAVVGACFSGTGLVAYSPISFNNQKHFSNIPLRGVEFAAAFLSSTIVLLVAMFSNLVPVVSWAQVAAYLVASCCLLGAAQAQDSFVGFMGSADKSNSKSGSSKKGKSGRIFPGLTLAIMIAISSLAVSFLSSLSVNSIGQSLPSTLDLSYKASGRFDIVVSIYDEDPILVKEMLDSIKSTSMLSTIKPNIIIYTKDPDANIKELKKATGADVVEKLENLGREGATYLHHIVKKWDKLAQQTMFIQAHAHNMRELTPRINDYLVTETGMLSLGFVGMVCDCQTCGDRWGWEDRFNAIPQLFQKIYKEPCDLRTPILLSYKGQFVASGKRIRGISKKIYEELLTMITSKDGEGHNGALVGENVDTPDNPYFGFTLERIWGLLMQCATDGGVASKCPSLLSGMSRNGNVGDCQCLDR